MSDFTNLPVTDPRRGGFVSKCDDILELKSDRMIRFFAIGMPKYLEYYGRWFFFNENVDLVRDRCKQAVNSGLVILSEYSLGRDDGKYMGALYAPYSDISAHQRAVRFLIRHDLIERTRYGRLYNMSLRTHVDFVKGNWGGNGKARKPVVLSDLVDLWSGELKDVSEKEWRSLLEPTVLEALSLDYTFEEVRNDGVV